MDQFFTVVILLALTVALASSLRKPAGAATVSVNWGGPAPAPRNTRMASVRGPRMIRALLTLLLALGFALALSGSQSAARPAHGQGVVADGPPPACVNWCGGRT